MQINIDPETFRKIQACLETVGHEHPAELFIRSLIEDTINPGSGFFEAFADGDEQLEARIEDILTC